MVVPKFGLSLFSGPLRTKLQHKSIKLSHADIEINCEIQELPLMWFNKLQITLKLQVMFIFYVKEYYLQPQCKLQFPKNGFLANYPLLLLSILDFILSVQFLFSVSSYWESQILTPHQACTSKLHTVPGNYNKSKKTGDGKSVKKECNSS